MAPTLRSAKLRLTYPVYACDFDPIDANRLVVGGGGGAGRSGVGNIISVLDTSQQDALEISAQIELSREEDNVSTLVVGRRRGKSLIVYAGCNSSPAELKKGKNEHFRIFHVEPPSRGRAADGHKITEAARQSLFTSIDPDTFQRILRVSPPIEQAHQLGAVATGLAKEAEIVLITVAPTASAIPKVKGTIQLAKEANDLDVIQVGYEAWQLAYCDNYQIHAMDVAVKSTSDPKCVYMMPNEDSVGGSGGRPAFRCIRYLTSNFILAVSNLPKAGGVLLSGFRLPGPGHDMARLAVTAKLPSNSKRSSGLAVCNLSPRARPSDKQGDTQFLAAVAGQDRSITLYSLEHKLVGEVNLLVNLFPITTLKEVHPGPLTDLTFSHLMPPAPTLKSPKKAASCASAHVPALKLASVGSVGNTLTVHTIPLKKIVDKKIPAARKGGPLRPVRYVSALEAKKPTATGLLVFMAVVACVLATLLQGFLKINGLS